MMDFGADQRMSRNTIIGIGIVILLHVFLVYALVTGLASSAVELIKKPLEIKIITPQTTPPPPPQVIVPPPPKLTAPPPPYIPPPLIQVQAPPQTPIAVTTTVKPTEAPPQASPVPAPVSHVSNSVGAVCPNVGAIAQNLQDQFDRIADNLGITTANVTIEVTEDANGNVSNPRVVSSTAAPLDQIALQAAGQLHCRGQGRPVELTAPFTFESN
jgi:protein TonB